MAAQNKPLSENEIIALIGRLKCSQKNLVAGDDITRFTAGKTAYAASDSLIENVHYKAAWLSPADIAYKLFARNWSDFLCKGITANHALLNLNIKPDSASATFLRPFLRELDRLMTRYGITLIGGDTARAAADVLTMTFLGSKGKFIPRQNHGIRVGDLIVQLGGVGGSDAARRSLEQKSHYPPKLHRHFTRPQLFDSMPAQKYLKASIDQSDSVTKSLHILAGQNRANLVIDAEKIVPSHKHVAAFPEILNAAEDLAVFAIAHPNIGKSTTAFRVIGHVESIRGKRPGVVYRHRGKTVSHTEHGFEHFENSHG